MGHSRAADEGINMTEPADESEALRAEVIELREKLGRTE